MAEKIIFLIIAAIIMCTLVFAQYETLEGIAADSPEYNEYKMCVDSCGQCETNCKSNVYRRAAEMQGDEALCNNLPEAERPMCLNRAYTMKAMTSKNSADCQKITEEMEKNSCILNVQTEKAIAGENEAECNSAPETMIEFCKQSFNQRMAMQKQDQSYCAKIADEMSRTICSDTVAMQKGAAPGISAGTTSKEAPGEALSASSKSLITYGIIILGVIIIAVIAIIIIKKTGGKKPAQPVPLFVQQQKFPPLVMQQQQQIQQGDKK